MLTCGFYHKENTKMTIAYRHMNTFMGDPIRTVLSAAQNTLIKEDKLTELAAETGTYLVNKLEPLAAKHPEYVSNIRGKGTYLAFDVETPELRTALIDSLKK